MTSLAEWSRIVEQNSINNKDREMAEAAEFAEQATDIIDSFAEMEAGKLLDLYGELARGRSNVYLSMEMSAVAEKAREEIIKRMS